MGWAKTAVDEDFVRTPNFAPDGPQRPAEMQLRTAVGAFLLARRKSGVQIPSPPPHRKPWLPAWRALSARPEPFQIPLPGSKRAASANETAGRHKWARFSDPHEMTVAACCIPLVSARSGTRGGTSARTRRAPGSSGGSGATAWLLAKPTRNTRHSRARSARRLTPYADQNVLTAGQRYPVCTTIPGDPDGQYPGGDIRLVDWARQAAG
jgi:hypothetical protein